MSRHGYGDCDDASNWDHIKWRGQVASAMRGKKGQAFLREMLKALDALPRPRLVAGVLQEGEWGEEEDTIVPVKDGDVCAFGAVGRSRNIEMPAHRDAEDAEDDDLSHEVVQRLFGTPEAMSCEIMYVNDEGGCGRRVPIPHVLGEWEYKCHGGKCWEYYGYKRLPETPEERFARVRRWVLKHIHKGDHYPNEGEPL